MFKGSEKPLVTFADRAHFQIVIVMELPGSCFTVSSISVSANVVEHPQNDPIIACSGGSALIIPPLRRRVRRFVDPENSALEGFIRKVVCRERRRHVDIGWFQHFSLIFQKGLEGTDGFLLVVFSIFFRLSQEPLLYLHG